MYLASVLSRISPRRRSKCVGRQRSEGKVKGEKGRETLERLVRTVRDERPIMRKEVKAIQAAWGMLESEIENRRVEMNEPDDCRR